MHTNICSKYLIEHNLEYYYATNMRQPIPKTEIEVNKYLCHTIKRIKKKTYYYKYGLLGQNCIYILGFRIKTKIRGDLSKCADGIARAHPTTSTNQVGSGRSLQ